MSEHRIVAQDRVPRLYNVVDAQEAQYAGRARNHQPTMIKSCRDRRGRAENGSGRETVIPRGQQLRTVHPMPYLTAASFGQSSICTRATSRYLPSSGLKIDASPSFTSNQSLPKVSTMLGLCVMRKVFLPRSGTCASILRSAAARRLFSSGDTTSPPSVRSVVFSMSLNPASTAVSKARLNLLV